MLFKQEEIVAYEFEDGTYCPECVPKDRLADVKANEIVTQKTLDKLEVENDFLFCDGCEGRISSP